MGRVVVVGGGISGLAAAWELSGGPDGVDADPDGTFGSGAHVVVIESTSRLGGALDSAKFGGRIVDTGPDGFLGRRPEALDLCHEIGLGDALVPIAGRGAGVWARGRVRPLPDGLALGIPTRFWPAARSGILGLRGQLGLARDALLPRPDVRGPIGDRSIGPLVARKLGQRVADRLVDPLIGGIHAGSVDDMSAAATYPPLLVAAQKRGSLMRGAARRGACAPSSRRCAPVVLGPQRRHGRVGRTTAGRAGSARGRDLVRHHGRAGSNDVEPRRGQHDEMERGDGRSGERWW